MAAFFEAKIAAEWLPSSICYSWFTNASDLFSIFDLSGDVEVVWMETDMVVGFQLKMVVVVEGGGGWWLVGWRR